MIRVSLFSSGSARIETPYDPEINSALRKIPGHRWFPERKVWSVPAENMVCLYDVIEPGLISASPEAEAIIAKHTGEIIHMWRIRPGVVEIAYHFEKDIDAAVRGIVCRYSTSINHWLITDDDAKHLIGLFGRDRFCFHAGLPEDSGHSDLKPSDNAQETEPSHLDLIYDDPFCRFNTSYDLSNALRRRSRSVTWDKAGKTNVIPISEVPQLIALLGKTNVGLSSEAEARIKEIYSVPVPAAERLKDVKPCVSFDFKTPPYPHQIEAFNFGLNHDRILIADECGCGKTIESLTIAIARKQYDDIKKTLIICGVNSVKYNWLEEIKEHTNEKGVVIDGSSPKKKAAQTREWLDSPDIFFGIINIEALRLKNTKKSGSASANPITEMLIGSVDMIITDEIHKAKNASSQQGKALQALKAKYEIGLSGTPMTNRPEDLYGVLAWLGIERRNNWNFNEYYCIKGGFKNKQIIGYRNQDELAAMLRTVMIRRRKEEILDLPDKTYVTEHLSMSQTEAGHYRDAENNILQVLDEILDSSNPLTHLLRLKQVTSGIFEDNEKNDTKLQRVIDYIDNEFVPNGQKVLIFSQFETVAARYVKALSRYNPACITGAVSPADRQKEVTRFQNDPDCPVAIGTIGAMGTGLNMTAASYVIFIDKAWTEADNEQAEDRAHRIGTKHNVTIITLCAKGTIDERIEEMLKAKAELFDEIVNGRTVSASSRRELVLNLVGRSQAK